MFCVKSCALSTSDAALNPFDASSTFLFLGARGSSLDMFAFYWNGLILSDAD